MATSSAPLAALNYPEFRRYLIGRFLFIMGLRMIGMLVGWWMYELTGDPLSIGLIGLAEVIPALLFALYAGHVIDKSNKRTMIIASVLLYAVCAALLLLTSLGASSRELGKGFVVASIYGIIFLTGAIRAFSGPTFSATIALIVPREALPNAITWSSGSWLLASVTGHAAAGFLIAGFGNTGVLATVLCLVIASLVSFAGISSKPPMTSTVQQNTWESVKEGLQFVYRTKEVLGALALDLFAVLFGGAVAMVPIYAKDILKVGPVGFGWLNAAGDIGSILIILLITIFPLRRRQGKYLLAAVAGFGVCIIVFGISDWFWISFAALLLAGFLDGISVVIRSTILQLKTPDNMRGRVMAVNSMFINSSNELGQFESGLAARLLGVRPSVVFGGVMTIVVVIFTSIKAPSLRKMEY
jgi:MFS family permease